MNEALGSTAGNALEVREAVDLLAGRAAEPRLLAVTLALAAEMLVLGGLAAKTADAETRLREALASGAAAERFARMVAALGGPGDLLERPDRHLPSAPVKRAVLPRWSGFVTAVDARALGLLVVELGGGRRRADDTIDPAVGLADVAGVGEAVGPDRPLAIVHARSASDAEAAATVLRSSMTLGDYCVPSASPAVVGRTPERRGTAASSDSA
jgi:thymidine phosphorylase